MNNKKSKQNVNFGQKLERAERIFRINSRKGF